MTARLMFLLLLAQTALTVSAPAAAEPNDTIPEPIFEIRSWPQKGLLANVRSRYAAEITLPWGEITLPEYKHYDLTEGWARITMVKSRLVQKLSPAQRQSNEERGFVDVRTQDQGIPANQFCQIRFVAVSEEDAKTLAWALLDGLTIQMQEDCTEYRHRLEQVKQRYEHARTELPAKKKRLEEVEAQYDRHKRQIYPDFIDEEAVQQAKERMIQMDREADALDIELAGIRAKLKIIDDYRSRTNLSNHIIEKLETMRIDQLIEESGLAARRETVERIHTAQQQFHQLYLERESLRGTVSTLGRIETDDQFEIDRLTEGLKYVEEKLIAPLEDPKRKVTIYSKIPEDSQN